MAFIEILKTDYIWKYIFYFDLYHFSFLKSFIFEMTNTILFVESSYDLIAIDNMK